MSRAIVPTSQLQRRLPEAGRIRTGVKRKTRGGKEAPASIPEFRFTSHDRPALDQIAEMYGGEVAPWSDPKAAAGQFEVITEAAEIRVVLPPDPLGGTPIYESWGGGGCERRCNGVDCTILQQGPDGLEPTEVPCICDARGEMACKVITRLTVILPEVRFAGVWRLDTKSWNAAQELPGMVDMVQQIQSTGGLSYATLALKQRRSVAGGQTHHFAVPMLGIPNTIEQLAAGQGRLGSLPQGPSSGALELEAGSSGGADAAAQGIESGESGTPSLPDPDTSPGPLDVDEEIVDAEIVESPQVPPEPAGASAPDSCSRCGKPWSDGALTKGGPGESRFIHTACADDAGDDMGEGQRKFIFAELRKRQITGPRRFEWATGLLGRDVTTFNDLTKADAEVLISELRGAA